ncbi:helix-turn-helix domain-containing protein [Chryseobacterium turcicum]|uniref:Helix-turn-helix domain-containing protein n=1 Tax=Chryseobacterium turcicum TaxID=2898076 RepID=A0A9Q3YVN0_9FLAO|nr:helix-turn-helix domain-containing protein [Chryseobacterium turcicum]MCD1117611.1 helix-turn-helix domain-containing protein [Chryseobacterium turcicum]
MKHFKTITELYTFNGFPPPENPLLGLVTFEDIRGCKFVETEFTLGFYKIALKKVKSGNVMYGRTKYDHENGSMFFLKPNQIIQMNDIELTEKGFMIYIHEDFLINHSLHSSIQKYGFFDYETNEALHLSPSEEETLWELFNKIKGEYYNNQDEFSKDIILTHIDSILKYSQRFYKRQFLNRNVLSGTTVSKFTEVLKLYFENGSFQKNGLPTVKYMAERLNLSSRYLSDLLKQETGKTALEHIHIALVMEAKNILMSTDKTVAETAYELGFENPPYFSRLFKKEVGLTPTEYREQFLN